MKKILVALLAIILLAVATIAVAAFVTPTDFRVERDIVINKPRAEVFEYTKHIKNQNDWGTWMKKDPKTEQTYSGTDGTEGFTVTWKSDHPDVGSGEHEIIKVTENERVDSKLRFKEPFESEADAYIAFEDAGENQTKVKWGFTGSMPRPFNLMTLFIDMEEAVGKDFEDGLASLKDIVEKQKSPESDEDGDSDKDENKKVGDTPNDLEKVNDSDKKDSTSESNAS
ncbi:MAG: SRPBCC family protein [Pyrinomonadaceae bacterium]|nr:SRPBCC family protein [Pyrinomonadaceae bacterium]